MREHRTKLTLLALSILLLVAAVGIFLLASSGISKPANTDAAQRPSSPERTVKGTVMPLATVTRIPVRRTATLPPPPTVPQRSEIVVTVVTPGPWNSATPAVWPIPSAGPTEMAEARIRRNHQELWSAPGVVIAQSAKTTSDGKKRIRTYMVEEITLDQPTEIFAGSGEIITILRAWRFTIMGQVPNVSNDSYYISLRGLPFHFPRAVPRDPPGSHSMGAFRGVLNTPNHSPPPHLADNHIRCEDKGDRCVALLMKPDLLQEGACISVTYGYLLPMILPETLHFTTPPTTNTAPAPVVTAEPTYAEPIVPVVPTGTYSPVIWPEPTVDPTQVIRTQQMRHLSDVAHNAPGVVIAQGSNATPVGKAGVLSYTVEEVPLSEPLNFGIDERGNDLIASKFWRITISANQLRMGALGNYIHLNDEQVSICGEQTGGCMGIVLKQELLVEGAKISLSYGGLSPTDLPERLHFSITPGTAAGPDS